MLPEVKSLESQLKQILYGCVEHVQATKAALYLSSSADLNDKRFELVTSYQYNVGDRKVVTGNDDLVDRLSVKRTSFYVNGVGSDQRLAEMLFRQGTDRILVTPLFSRGRLVGFIDMRDKAGKKPFDAPDLKAANDIAEEMLRLLVEKKLFGLAPMQLSSEPHRVADGSQANLVRQSPPLASAPVVSLPPAGVFSPEALRAIEAARQFMSKRQLTTPQAARRTPSSAELDLLRISLPAVLAIPGAALATLSVLTRAANPHSLVAVAAVSDDAMDALFMHLNALLKRANQPHDLSGRREFGHPFGVQSLPITAAAISTIVSAPLSPQLLDGLFLTVAFERVAEADAHRSLHSFIREIEPSIDSALSAAAGRSDRQAIAERLVEPDFSKFPDLVDHSREVAAVAQRFATVIELSPSQIETVRIAALVHDVGLRLLDYERLYRKSSLTPEEMRGLAEHPVVGAALVEPLLGSDVAHAVLRHHERVDGKGYPSRLSGAQIPLASRIIQLADAWVAMTSRHSYRPPISRDEALTHLRDGAGTQFDAALVDRFIRSVERIAN
jgi:hypothetical protein